MSKIEDAISSIQDIAEIIHMQMPLKYQDKWLEMMIEQGLYTPKDD